MPIEGGAVAEWSKPFGLSHTVRRYPRFVGSSLGCGRVIGCGSLLGTLPVIGKIENHGPAVMLSALGGLGK